MKFTPKHTGCCFCSQSVFREDRRTRKAKLIIPLKLFMKILLCFTKLRTVTFIKDKDNLLLIDRQGSLCLHQVIQFLNCRYDNLVIVLVNVSF